MKFVLITLLFGRLLAEEALAFDGQPKTDPLFSDESQPGPITRLQNNCLAIRFVLAALPTYAPAKESILNYFRKPPERNFKSFRKIMITILESIYYSKEDVEQGEREGIKRIKTLVDELAAAKEDYATNYLQVDEKKFQIEKEKIEKLEAEKEKISQQIQAEKKMYMEEGYRKTHLMSEIQGFSEEFNSKGLTERVAQFLQLEEMENQILVAYQNPEVTEAFKEGLNQNGLQSAATKIDSLVALDAQATQFKRLKELVELYEDVPSSVKEALQGMDSAPTPIQHEVAVSDGDTLQKKIDALDAAIDKEVKAIQAEIVKKKDKLKAAVGNVSGYKEYYQNVERFKKLDMESIKRRIDDLTEQDNALNEQIKLLELNSHLDFTLARDSQSKLEEKVETLKIEKERLAESDLGAFFQTTENNFTAIYNKYLPIFTQFDFLEKSIEFYSRKLEKIVLINSIEQEIDVRLGHIFAEVQYLPGDLRCFSIAHLSYIVFDLVKINAIVHEQEFLGSYLEGAGYLRAKEFIIYNYTLFVGPDFIKKQFALDDLKLNFGAEMQADQDLVKDLYIKNWCFLVSVYKEYTEFGTQSEDAELKKVKFNFSRRLLAMLGFDQLSLVGMAKGAMIVKLGGTLVGELIKMIPFIGNIPFLDSLLKYIFGKTVNLILNMIIKFTKNHAEQIEAFWNVFKKLFDRFRSPDIISADYRFYLNNPTEGEGLDPEEKAKLSVGADQIEQVYLNVLEEDIKARDSNVRKVFIFEKSFRSTEPSSLRNAPKKSKLSKEAQNKHEDVSQDVNESSNSQDQGKSQIEERILYV